MGGLNYQDMIRALEAYWADQGCVLMQPYHTELGAGTMNPATFLRCLGPKPWRAAYVEPVTAEMTYGLERLALFLQGKRSAFDLEWAPGVTWGEVYREAEREWSAYNFEEAPVETLMRRFDEHEAECRHLLERGLPLPAYDQVLKASHVFNLLEARGAISVTARAAYIGRVRDLAREVARLYLASQAEQAEEAQEHADAAA